MIASKSGPAKPVRAVYSSTAGGSGKRARAAGRSIQGGASGSAKGLGSLLRDRPGNKGTRAGVHRTTTVEGKEKGRKKEKTETDSLREQAGRFSAVA